MGGLLQQNGSDFLLFQTGILKLYQAWSDDLHNRALLHFQHFVQVKKTFRVSVHYEATRDWPGLCVSFAESNGTMTWSNVHMSTCTVESTRYMCHQSLQDISHFPANDIEHGLSD